MTSRVAQRAAERAQHRIVLELQNRIGMLCVHGGILVSIGVMMILTGAPVPTEDWFGAAGRCLAGTWAALAGLTVLVGAALSDDSRIGWLLMTLGTTAAGLWHAGLAATYVYAVATTQVEILGPDETLGSDVAARGYIPLVYLGYVMLVFIHNVTLLRLGPPPR